MIQQSNMDIRKTNMAIRKSNMDIRKIAKQKIGSQSRLLFHTKYGKNETKFMCISVCINGF